MVSFARKRIRRAVTCAVLASSVAAVAGCASQKVTEVAPKKRSKEYFAESMYGVKASPRVSNLRTKLPRGGGRDQTGQPYMVKGKWYYPREDKNYKKVGGASWYGDAFHGRLTANGEVYDMTHLTAAHPTMPLPSYARVTNMKNGSSVIVRVNDRGPYEKDRIIDLSHRAAELLDYAHAGMASVKVEYVGRAPLDGHDDQFLMASYKPGNGAPDPSDGLPTGVMIAMNGPTPKRAAPAAIAFPRQPSAEPPAVNTAGLGTAALPDSGPVAPSRPGLDAQGRMVLSGLSYAAAEPQIASSAAFAAFDRAASGSSGSFVAAATLTGKADARALADRLSAFGAASIEKEAEGAFNVELRSDGRLPDDALLQAAWANGAPDAMTVRN